MATRCACAILCDRVGCIRVSRTPMGLGLLYLRACVCARVCVCLRSTCESLQRVGQSSSQTVYIIICTASGWRVAGSPTEFRFTQHCSCVCQQAFALRTHCQDAYSACVSIQGPRGGKGHWPRCRRAHPKRTTDLRIPTESGD